MVLAILALLGSAAAPADAADRPGQVPKSGLQVARRDAPVTNPADGLKVIFERYGKYRLSVDAAGSNDAKHTISVNKPFADATVEKAFLMAASWQSTPIENGDVKLDGHVVTWSSSVALTVQSQPGFFHNVLGDVTSIVKPKVDAAAPGIVNFKIAELQDNDKVFLISGEILAVVFKTPSAPAKRTISLLFGGLETTGDTFELQMAAPIDPKKPSARLDLGLGVSFSICSFGSADHTVVKVNNKLLTSAAGCEDDGESHSGASITVGGIGDQRANPVDPNQIPTSIRYDDELYNLLPFIDAATTKVTVETNTPSQGDNVLFAYFDTTASIDAGNDEDGDGLLDVWETSGYDHDGDDVVDVPLHRLGANPRHKDLFIAYAWMKADVSESVSHRPSATVLDAVKAAFARAPVSNPDGKNGINIHWRNLGGVTHDADLNPVWTDFDAIMDPLVTEAERKVYRRMLNGHDYNGTGSSGIARGIPASDFVESLGMFPSNPGTFKERAGTIMHELGHTLGLRHGGVDHENYKPNHLSVMSYLNQLDWLKRNQKDYLDYERFDLVDIDESAASEPKGLDRTSGDATIGSYGVRWYSGGSLLQKDTGSSANVDWNDNGSATDDPVAVDLNDSGSQGVLRGGFREWENIVFDGGEIGAGKASRKNRFSYSDRDLIEMTYEDYVRMQKRLQKR